MTLIWILAACLLSTCLSLLLAYAAAHRIPTKALSLMVAFSAGTMLSAALMDVLPEALEQEGVDPHLLFGVLLLALLCFYFMERAALWRHHHHSPDAAQDLADTAVPHHHADLKPARYAALLGDGVHNFVDGLLIAAAFMADPWLGVTTAAAIFVHELPQEIGKFALYLASGWTKTQALTMNLLGGMTSLLGGLVGWWLLEPGPAIPYVLMVTVASFVYISLADLMPFLHKQHGRDGFAPQSALLILGVSWVPTFAHFFHH